MYGAFKQQQTLMKKLITLLLLTITACVETTPQIENPYTTPLERIVFYDFPATDIWADSLANPGKVSDLGPEYVGPNDQTRQLPSRKAGDIIFPSGQTRYHSAVIDSEVWDGPYLAGYWMEGVTSLHIKRPDLGVDTVLTLAPCRFFAGTDSYPSRFGYKQWHRKTSTGTIPVVRPRLTARVNDTRIGIYSVGDTLSVRADMSLDGQIVSRWWIEIP